MAQSTLLNFGNKEMSMIVSIETWNEIPFGKEDDAYMP
jgi:hypothetical protein